MANVEFDKQTIEVKEGKSVLDALLDNDFSVPNSCRAGVCQSCLMRAENGKIPADAQAGLKETLKSEQFFLACRCYPTEDLAITLPETSLVRTAVTVIEKRLLSDNVMGLWVDSQEPLEYRAGQHVMLWLDADSGRSYSLASVPGIDMHLEFHIQQVPQGQVSNRVFNQLSIGDEIEIQGPSGHCFYTGDHTNEPMLLMGTGTGLAPLYGIARDALRAHHQGPIHLFHGALNTQGLYLFDELAQLAHEHSNFYYHPAVLDNGSASVANNIHPKSILVGQVDKIAMEQFPKLDGWRVYLCGPPEFVDPTRKNIFLAGASMNNIFSDAFLPAATNA